jgi:Cof subfamily protein (haloacid dehalogenase superfamily)
MKYRLLGIDVDGTLLGKDHRLDPQTARTIASARSAGLRVVLATGRTLSETIEIWRQLDLREPSEPLVLVGGALVAEGDTGRTLYHRTIPLSLAAEFADALGEAGYAPMMLVDPWRHGWDYVLCEVGDVEAARGGWLDKTGANVRTVKSVSDRCEIPNPLRISAVVDPEEAPPLVAQLNRTFDGRINVHAIVAPNYDATVVEAFAAGVDKFAALKYVAQAYRIGSGSIAAIGDDINDLGMIRGAGLGAAMPDAPASVREQGDHVAAGGLVEFIEQLIDGRFE